VRLAALLLVVLFALLWAVADSEASPSRNWRAPGTGRTCAEMDNTAYQGNVADEREFYHAVCLGVPWPPEPPVASWGPTGVSEHLARIRWCESRDDYQAYNPVGPFMGAYQFIQSTWDSVAPPEWVGVDPRYVPPEVQDFAALRLYQTGGPGHWPVCQYR
jgi:hypothetical protein